MNELISIIVPIYNSEKYLKECIESIINQTYKNIEVILINDGSTDASEDVCNEYAKNDNRIKIINIKNAGVSNARNVGIDSSKGNWIVFVDSDDWIEKDFCEKLYKEATQDKELDIICSGYKRIYSDKTEKINCNNKKITYNAHQYLLKLLNVQNGYGFCHMKLIRKKCIGHVRFNKNIKVGEDALFNMQLVKNTRKVIILGEALYNYRFNENSLVRKYDEKYVEKYLLAMQETLKYLRNEYKEDNVIKENFYNYVSYHVLLIAVNYCFNPKNGQSFLKQKRMLKEVCKIKLFAESIKNSNYKDLSKTRMVTLFTIKHNLFTFTSIICKIRQVQFKNN